MPNLDVCGTIYPYPNVGDNPWGIPHIDWATAVSACLTTLNTQVNVSTMPNVFTSSGDMVYANPAVVPTRLPIGVIGRILTVSSAGLPAWEPPAAGSVSVPIGSVISWDDYNGVLTLDPNYRYCDGLVINAPGSPLDGLATRDLSGAYIVGYGTLGSGDIGSALYDVTPIGNSNNQVALNHTHTYAHTHPGPSHQHGGGTLSVSYGASDSNSLFLYDNGIGKEYISVSGLANPGVGFVNFLLKGPGWPAGLESLILTNFNGSTSSGGTGNTGAASPPGTSSSLSSTQSIQPRSQRFRMIIRVL